MPVDVVHRDGQRGLAVRRDAGLRRRRPAHVQPRPGLGRARDHPAHEGDHAGAPARPAGRHGRAARRSPSATASRSSRTPRARSARATRGGRSASLGPLACFSLHPRKVITTGEGGMITVQDPAVAERLRQPAPARDGRLGPGPPRREGRRHRVLSRARLELPHDRHAGGARPLPARAARRDPRRARRGSPQRYTDAIERDRRASTPPYEPGLRRAHLAVVRGARSPRTRRSSATS